MDIQSLGDASTGAAAPPPQTQPQAAAAPSTPPPGTQDASSQAAPAQGSSEKTLAHTVGDLFGASSHNVHVSYRIEKPDEIVTVFTDASGHEITQVPSEAMIQIAQFFDTQTGVTVDRNA